MSRINEIEIDYDDHTLLIGDLVLPPGFDQEPDKRNSVEIENFSVIVFIGNIDYDVTDASLVQKSLSHFKEVFLDKAYGKYIDDLKEGA